MTEKTFISIFEKNQGKLFRLAKRLLQDTALAEDAVQDLAIKLFRKREQLTKYSNLDVMMMVSMKNHCFDELKKRKRKQTNSLDGAKIVSINNRTPDRILEGKQKMHKIKELIDQLPETQRLLMQLRDIEQLEMAEIEEITGIKAGAIRTNLSRARKTIREQLKQMNRYGLESY